MMRNKLLLVIAILLVLTGCSTGNDNYSDDTLKKDIASALDNGLNVQLPAADQNNYSKDYYSYYASIETGRIEASDTTNTFVLADVTAVLKLNIVSIVLGEYYQQEKPVENEYPGQKVYVKNGTMVNTAGRSLPYSLAITKVSDSEYMTFLQNKYFSIEARCQKTQLADALYEMVKLIRTCDCQYDHVLANYSIKHKGETLSDEVTLFPQKMSESGKLEDFIEDWKNDSAFEIIDNTIENKDNEDIDYGDIDTDDEIKLEQEENDNEQ